MTLELTGEALFVGIGNYLIHRIVKRMFPKNEAMQLFASGVMFHLLSEVSGLNAYYVDYKIAPNRRTGRPKIMLDTSRRQPCQPTQSTIQDSSLSFLGLEYSDTISQPCEPYRPI